MGNPWYRAWVGLVSDEKIAEAALIADAPRCLVIAVWHALLESASDVDDSGSFVTTPRRIGAILYEPAARIQAVFSALEELGMIRDGHVVAWAKRQPARESGAEGAERQRRFRDRRRESGAKETGPGVTRNTLSHDVTRPETESETDISSSSRASAGATPQIDLSQARPLPKRDLLEAEATEDL